MGEPVWLERWVEWYEKDPGEALIGEQRLSGVQLAELQSLWSRPSSDPMVLCYPIGEAQRAYIEAHAGVPLLLDTYDYFAVCLTNDLDAARRDGGYMGQVPAPAQWGRHRSVPSSGEAARSQV